MNISSGYIVLLFFTILSGCKSGNQHEEGVPLVSVGNKVLYSSVIAQLLPEGTSPEDSAAIVKGYIENWVRDHLVISEAEKNIPPDLNLNKLVNGYRSSLLMYHFENQIIKEKLDTLVTPEQKNEFYQEYGSQFILSHKIVKAIVISSDKNSKSLSNFAAQTGKQSADVILTKAKKDGYKILLNGIQWIPAEDVTSYTTKLKPEQCQKGFQDVFTSGNKKIFIKILDSYKENQIPPLEYIEEKIEQVMLNYRKTQLLKSIREELYQEQMNEGTITYH